MTIEKDEHHFNQSLNYFRKKDYENALNELNQAIKHRALPKYFNAKGLIYYYQQNYEMSVLLFNTAVMLNPSKRHYENRAKAYLKLKEWQKAHHDLIEAVKYGSYTAFTLIKQIFGTTLAWLPNCGFRNHMGETSIKNGIPYNKRYLFEYATQTITYYNKSIYLIFLN